MKYFHKAEKTIVVSRGDVAFLGGVVRGDANKKTFSGLDPWRKLFSTGLPILTYHHVGARPAGVQWRGLWVSPRLFARQLRELHKDGFRSTSLDGALPSRGNTERRCILSFDDGYVSVFENAICPLARFGFRGIQFLVAGHIGGLNSWDVAAGERPTRLMDESQVQSWLKAGHEIGSHTVSHPRLTRIPRARQREEIRASKRMLEDRFAVEVRHLCYPYGDFDDWVVEFVADAGYSTACTHLESGVNTAETHRLKLRRIECRYPTRNLRTLWGRLRDALRF